MNPTFTVSVDAEKRKTTVSGLVAVGEKVDVVVSGLEASQIPEWENDNAEGFSGPSLRFRLVAPDGRDLVRFPLAEGDAWSAGADGTFTAEVDFNTMQLRGWLRGFGIGEKAEVGIIVDSVVDAMEYGRGTVKVLQWAASPAEDPTILPDWRKTLRDLTAAIVRIDGSVDLAMGYANDAEMSAGQSAEKASVAETAANNALSSASAALGYKGDAESAASTASNKASEAAGSAGDAADSATTASGAADRAEAALEGIDEAIAGKADKTELEAEVSRATQAESDLETAILVEENRASAEEAAIDNKLNAEVIRAGQAEEELAADIADRYTKSEVDSLIEAISGGGVEVRIVESLPQEGIPKVLYFVPRTDSETRNIYDEYMWISSSWEKIGSTDIDLSGYYQKPSGGIPKTDLSAGVQASLDKADSALQSISLGGTPLSRELMSPDSVDIPMSEPIGDVSFVGAASAFGTYLKLFEFLQMAVQQIAPVFTAKAYVLNELCTFSGVVYRCKLGYIATASSEKPSNDRTHWEAKKVSELFVPWVDGNIFLDAFSSVSVGGNDAGSTKYRYGQIFHNSLYEILLPSASGTIALLENIAPAFSTSVTYEANKLCVYNKALYRCKTAITTAGAWDSSKWTMATVQDVLTAIWIALALKAPLASPAFTGTPTAPTPTAGDNSTKVATTAFVKNAIGGVTPNLDYVMRVDPETGGIYYTTPDTNA